MYGIPLVLLILTLLLAGREGRNWRRFAFAGVVAGILPLAHLGSFAALGLIAPFLVLLFPQRGWLAFFGVWILVGGAFLFGVQGGEARSSSGLRWEPGWLADEDPWPWFWIKNLGLLIPFGAVALVSRTVIPAASRRLLLAFLPIFLVANTFILSVVRWDNSKVLLFFFLALVILAAAAVVALWRVQRDPLSRALLALAVVSMVASGVAHEREPDDGARPDPAWRGPWTSTSPTGCDARPPQTQCSSSVSSTTIRSRRSPAGA